MNLLLAIAVRFAALYVVAYFLGLLVLERGVKVNYTRKSFRLLLSLLMAFVVTQLSVERSPLTVCASGAVFLLFLVTLTEPVRSRSRLLETVFAGIDRPEDRPFTLSWLSTQSVVTYVLMVVAMYSFRAYEREALLYAVILIIGFGDGLAEPIGVRFGRHKYSTRALFTDRQYTRSLEGSACVLVTGIIVVCCFWSRLNAVEFGLLLLTLPITMTLAEAKSPHTWDNPFMLAVGGINTVLVVEAAKVLRETA